MEDGEEAISCLAGEGAYSEFVSCPPAAGTKPGRKERSGNVM